jgi:hypothetical protein
MGRYSPQYTDAQRAAVVRAVVEGGLTATQAVEAAAAGALGIEPFEMPAATARGLVSEHRMEHGQGSRALQDQGAVERILASAYSILETRIDALSEDPAGVDLVELQRIARATREVQKLAFALDSADVARETEDESSSRDEFAEFLEREALAPPASAPCEVANPRSRQLGC